MKLIPISKPYIGGYEKEYSYKAIKSTWISSRGIYINKFEKSFSTFNKTKYSVSVCNGSVALILALKTLNISYGDEVIVPNITFAATINSVINVGAKPVIIDINSSNWTIDYNQIKKKISKKTKAVIVVHTYGCVADISKIKKIINEKKIKIIEDCAEAHGAKYKSVNVGNFSDISCFSFFANKIFSTGEGGMCSTNNFQYYKRLKLLRNHGLSDKKKYLPVDIGFNFRMTNLQAAIGFAQLKRSNKILNDRERIKFQYLKNLQSINKKIFFPEEFPNCKNVNWIFTIIIKNCNIPKLIKYLFNKKIETRPIFYPFSRNRVYKNYKNINDNYKNSIYLEKYGISLPTYYGIKNSSIKYICDQIKKFLNEKK